MFESTKNTFLEHFGDMRDDMCGSTMKMWAGINDNTSNNHIVEGVVHGIQYWKAPNSVSF